jgi:hypothetical protein
MSTIETFVLHQTKLMPGRVREVNDPVLLCRPWPSTPNGPRPSGCCLGGHDSRGERWLESRLGTVGGVEQAEQVELSMETLPPVDLEGRSTEPVAFSGACRIDEGNIEISFPHILLNCKSA